MWNMTSNFFMLHLVSNSFLAGERHQAAEDQSRRMFIASSHDWLHTTRELSPAAPGQRSKYKHTCTGIMFMCAACCFFYRMYCWNKKLYMYNIASCSVDGWDHCWCEPIRPRGHNPILRVSRWRRPLPHHQPHHRPDSSVPSEVSEQQGGQSLGAVRAAGSCPEQWVLIWIPRRLNHLLLVISQLSSLHWPFLINAQKYPKSHGRIDNIYFILVKLNRYKNHGNVWYCR